MRDSLARRAALLVAALCLASGFAGAEEAPGTLTLGQAEAAALRNNLGLKSAYLAERSKRRAEELSFNKFYPTISADAGAMRLNEVDPSLVGSSYSRARSLAPGETLGNDDTFYYGVDRNDLALGLSVREVFSVSSILAMNQAALAYQASSLDRLRAEKRMRASVKEAFYRLIVQKETIALEKARLAEAVEDARQAKASYEAGVGSELDYLGAKADAESLAPDLRSMETARSSALAQFQDMLGFDPRPDMELEGTLDDEAPPGRVDDSPGRTPLDVLAARLSLDSARSGLKLEEASLLPSLALQYKADPVLNGPRRWAAVADPDNWSQSSGGLYLTLSWDLSPLIPGSDYSVRRRALAEKLELAAETAARARTSAGVEVASRRAAIADSLAKIESARRIAEDYVELYDKTKIAYEVGTVRYLDLQNAGISSQSSRIRLLEERLNLLNLVCDLEAEYAD